jgi:hypothetical protein
MLLFREITFKIKSIFCAVLDTQNDKKRGLRALCDAFPWSQGKEKDRVKMATGFKRDFPGLLLS